MIMKLAVLTALPAGIVLILFREMKSDIYRGQKARLACYLAPARSIGKNKTFY